MKIGILTQPLASNYGGLLQAWALQTTLEKLGHEVIILNRIYGSDRNPLIEFMAYIKRVILSVFSNNKNSSLTEDDLSYIRQHTTSFIAKYHHKSPDLHNSRELKSFARKNKIEAFVVGSDQCWRPRYSPNILNYFLDFAKYWDVKRLTYAASFGVDQWEFSPTQTDKCAALAKFFDAISVREESGVELCNKYLGVDAKHVLDPTLLLTKDDYVQLVKNEKEPQVEGDLFCYVLDMDDRKSDFIYNVAREMKLTPCFCMPRLTPTFTNYQKDKDACIFPPVTKWIRSFMDAEMVIADSFHGTVFSIIFNKPFWVLGNPVRGMARFYSLLKMFGLEERLITPERLANLNINQPIDWAIVNEKHESLCKQSLDFIKTNLK